MFLIKQEISHIFVILYAIAFLYRTQIRLYTKSQKSSVIGTCFHHDCKICKLKCSIIYIQTENIILYNTLCCIPLAISIALINLHQHIKCIYQNMTTTHTRINNLYFLRLNILIFFPDGSKLFRYIRFLLCLVQIILPFIFEVIVLVSL